MQHIGYVLKVFPRLSQTFVINELQAHQRAGCRVTIFSLKSPKPEDLKLVQLSLTAPVVYLKQAQESWGDELAELVQQHQISRLHAHFGNVATAIARLAARKANIPYTFTAHALDIFDDKVDQQKLREKIHNAAAVFTVSKFNVRHLTQAFDRRAILAYNGMPLERMPFSPKNRLEPTILAVGRLVEKKGFFSLLKACQELLARDVSYHCKIVGTGPLEESLRSTIRQLGLIERVELVGALRAEEVHECIRNATLLAAPCIVSKSGDRDGLPTVMLEAMALGTPCVSTDVTGIPEVILDRQTGLLIPQGNALRLADACQELLQNKDLADQLAKNARTLIEKKFDSDVTSKTLRKVWDHPQRRIVFRIHNRRGMGHWMRGVNLARELLHQEPWSDILFYTRAAPPFGIDGRLRYTVAKDTENLSFDVPEIGSFSPHVFVDDTILKDTANVAGGRRVFIMRKLAKEKQLELFNCAALRSMHLVIVPHTREEFAYTLPDWLEERTQFVGPIVRQPDSITMGALRPKYGLHANHYILVSSPGGGGFDRDAERLFDTIREVHQRLDMPHLRHVVVRGPNARVSIVPVDDRMTVVDAEPEMVSLFALANVVISAGGYNSVNEIRLTQRPAFFLPGQRKYDDQRQRVNDLHNRGLAWVFDEDDPKAIAAAIAQKIREPNALDRIAQKYKKDKFRPGNHLAAKAILSCAHQ